MMTKGSERCFIGDRDAFRTAYEEYPRGVYCVQSGLQLIAIVRLQTLMEL
jgi:hypothetical protein